MIKTKVLIVLSALAYIAIWGYTICIANIIKVDPFPTYTTTASPKSVETPEPLPRTAPEPTPETMTFIATAYCSCVECCGKSDGVTASGVIAKQGVTIAADWKVLSRGTVVYIEGVGTRTVQDKGGAIRGNKIDIYFDSHEDALEFGRRTVKLTIIK